MFKNIIVILILCFLIIGCDDSKSIKKPDNLIAKETMSDILYDLYIINAAKGVNRKILEAEGFMPETYVLNKYNIDSTQFSDSNTYYTFDNEVYKSIIDKVRARLEKEKKTFEDIREKEAQSVKKRQDSLSAKQRIRRDSINKSKLKDSIVSSLSKTVQ